MNRYDEIKYNYNKVLENIEKAKEKRISNAPIKLLAATKTVPVDEILYAKNELGLELVGENKVNELLSKYDSLKDVLDIHLIGHLQTNKVKQVVGKVSLIESVDSIHLAEEIDKQAKSKGIIQNILVEINSGREEAKNGVMPEDANNFMDSISSFSNIQVCGLMTMGPNCENIDDYRNYFRETYNIFIDNHTKRLHNIINPVLSMGMSDSYTIAVEMGATEIRVGSAIFGKRFYPTKNV